MIWYDQQEHHATRQRVLDGTRLASTRDLNRCQPFLRNDVGADIRAWVEERLQADLPTEVRFVLKALADAPGLEALTELSDVTQECLPHRDGASGRQVNHERIRIEWRLVLYRAAFGDRDAALEHAWLLLKIAGASLPLDTLRLIAKAFSQIQPPAETVPPQDWWWDRLLPLVITLEQDGPSED